MSDYDLVDEDDEFDGGLCYDEDEEEGEDLLSRSAGEDGGGDPDDATGQGLRSPTTSAAREQKSPGGALGSRQLRIEIENSYYDGEGFAKRQPQKAYEALARTLALFEEYEAAYGSAAHLDHMRLGALQILLSLNQTSNADDADDGYPSVRHNHARLFLDLVARQGAEEQKVLDFLIHGLHFLTLREQHAALDRLEDVFQRQPRILRQAQVKRLGLLGTDATPDDFNKLYDLSLGETRRLRDCEFFSIIKLRGAEQEGGSRWAADVAEAMTLQLRASGTLEPPLRLQRLLLLYQRGFARKLISSPEVVGVITRHIAERNLYLGRFAEAQRDFFECFEHSYRASDMEMARRMLLGVSVCAIMSEADVNACSTREAASLIEAADPEYRSRIEELQNLQRLKHQLLSSIEMREKTGYSSVEGTADAWEGARLGGGGEELLLSRIVALFRESPTLKLFLKDELSLELAIAQLFKSLRTRYLMVMLGASDGHTVRAESEAQDIQRTLGLVNAAEPVALLNSACAGDESESLRLRVRWERDGSMRVALERRCEKLKAREVVLDFMSRLAATLLRAEDRYNLKHRATMPVQRSPATPPGNACDDRSPWRAGNPPPAP